MATEPGESARRPFGPNHTIIRNSTLRDLARLALACGDTPASARKTFHAVDDGMSMRRG
jgi:hypothetical protein